MLRPSPLVVAVAAAAVVAASAPVAARAADPSYETTVTPAPAEDVVPEGRATSEVTRRDLERRLPRSAPDALRYEPGVFVQQTAHGQGSAYIRGLTGQQTVLLFDGIRLNNTTYRQGPNQYFFTLDARTIAAIEILRGGGSTRFGSDALGGVIAAEPLAPPTVDERGRLRVESRVMARATTADRETGGRGQIGVAWAPRRGGPVVRFLGGVGARSVGLLDGPPVLNPDRSTSVGELPPVPRYPDRDSRTQLGTGFKELTADGRLLLHLDARHTLTAAASIYRQSDVPRTDQCPPPQAPFDNCLLYEEQFRHLAYVAWDAVGLGRAARTARVTLSWQQQHERRRLDQPRQFTQNRGVDDVDTVGAAAMVRAATLRRGRVALDLEYGADSYVDLVRSAASTRFTDVKVDVPISRGQYLDGSRAWTGGLFVDAALALDLDAGPSDGLRTSRRAPLLDRPRVTVRAGARLGVSLVHAPSDPESGTRAVDRTWVPVAGHAGVEWAPHRALALLVNVDHSYRAPNLDDLTSRQQTGPGFQFENPDLSPERATTFELGARVRTRTIEADLWLFETLLEDAIIKSPRDASACPPSTPQCQSSYSKIQLVNAPALSELRGVEAAVRLRLPSGLTARATLAYAWGEGPRVGVLPSSTAGYDRPEARADRVPLSRVPPLNGTVELAYLHAPSGLSVGGALRWAAEQDRLALADYADARIPRFGTPGFAVFDVRASWRPSRRLFAALVVENVFDVPYRYHGSSVNGAGRGAILQLEAALN